MFAVRVDVCVYEGVCGYCIWEIYFNANRTAISEAILTPWVAQEVQKPDKYFSHNSWRSLEKTSAVFTAMREIKILFNVCGNF